MDIKVSIIVPVYNAEKYLNKCLDSLVNQTLKEIEIICVNDASTDGSLNILKGYAQKDSRLVVINQSKSGLSKTRNEALKLAKGEYIGFVDSDDWIDLDFYEKLYNAAKSNNVEIAAAGIISSRSDKTKTLLKYKKTTVYKTAKSKYNVCKIPKLCYVWNKIYRRTDMDMINIKFPENRFYEDIVYTCKVVHLLPSLVTVPNVYYFYRKNPYSIVNSYSPQKDSDYKFAVKECANYIINNNIRVSITDLPPTEIVKINSLGLTLMKIKKWDKIKQYYLFGRFKILEITYN